MPKVYSYFSRPPKCGLDKFDCRTRPEFVDECDINRIVARAVAGIPPRTVPTFYGDFTAVGDYQSCMDRLNNARAQFAALPAKVRDRFGNDPVRLLAFVLDAANREEAISLGLIPKPAAPAAPVVTDPSIQPPISG